MLADGCLKSSDIGMFLSKLHTIYDYLLVPIGFFLEN